MHTCRLQRSRYKGKFTGESPFVEQVEQMDKETRAVACACQNDRHCVVRFFRSKSGRH